MNVKDWVMISHICNKDALIRVVYIFNIIGQFSQSYNDAFSMLV